MAWTAIAVLLTLLVIWLGATGQPRTLVGRVQPTWLVRLGRWLWQAGLSWLSARGMHSQQMGPYQPPPAAPPVPWGEVSAALSRAHAVWQSLPERVRRLAVAAAVVLLGLLLLLPPLVQLLTAPDRVVGRFFVLVNSGRTTAAARMLAWPQQAGDFTSRAELAEQLAGWAAATGARYGPFRVQATGAADPGAVGEVTYLFKPVGPLPAQQLTLRPARRWGFLPTWQVVLPRTAVTVSTNVASAAVTVDGVPVYLGPAAGAWQGSVTTFAGIHQVRAAAPGALPLDLLLEPGQQHVHLEMMPAPAVVDELARQVRQRVEAFLPVLRAAKAHRLAAVDVPVGSTLYSWFSDTLSAAPADALTDAALQDFAVQSAAFTPDGELVLTVSLSVTGEGAPRGVVAELPVRFVYIGGQWRLH